MKDFIGKKISLKDLQYDYPSEFHTSRNNGENISVDRYNNSNLTVATERKALGNTYKK